jgi:hypothetical protein
MPAPIAGRWRLAFVVVLTGLVALTTIDVGVAAPSTGVTSQEQRPHQLRQFHRDQYPLTLSTWFRSGLPSR